MRVARTLSFTETVVAEVELPALQPGDALIKVVACGLCGSDACSWYVDQKAPAVLGHEPAGVVVDTGPGCRLEVGQRVFVHHHVSCGECHYCRRGYETNCALFKSSRLDPGGFAEFVRVPAENVERDTLILPESVSFEAATFIEPLACSVRAVDKLRLTPGDSVLMIGLGTMGLMDGAYARSQGAGLILGSDFTAERRDLASAPPWSFDHVFDPRDGDYAAQLREATGGRGPDHVIVGVGSLPALEQACEVVARGGSVVLFSPYAPETLGPLPLHRFYFGELSLTCSYSCAAKETRVALELIESGVVQVERLVSHRIPLEEVGPGILSTAKPPPRWLKAIVYPHELPPPPTGS
ncbi:MAG: alcohol dehydrogenase catalytic domain-containing protein [Planctomycetota bacterium]